MDYYHIIDQVHMLEVQNIPRINTAVAEWMSVVLFITLLKPRWETRKLIVINLSLLMAESAFLVLTENVPVWLWTPCMMVAYFLMIFQLWISSQISVKEAVYFGTQSFIIAEFAASLEWQLATFIYEGYDIDQSWIWFILLILVYGGVYLLLYGTLKNHLPREQEMHLTGQALVTEIGIAIFVFALSNIGFWEVRTPFSNHETISMFNMRTMMDLGGVAILFAHMLSCSQASMRTELNNVHKMLESQYQQYKLSRDSIEMVNYKYHDLKHKIAVLKSEEDPQKRMEYLNHMEEEIKQYELQNKTGNKVLDTILTGKSMYCNKHGITLTCVADGNLLSFVDVMDICSIFGNALDNAVESVLKIPDKDKRLIHVTVSRQKEFLLIRFENYFEQDLQIDRGNLVSTKSDKDFHGYGIKSIRYTVEKYHGAVNIKADNNWFDMKILIPIP